VKNGSQCKFNLPLQCWNSSLSKRSASNSFLWLKSSKLEQQKFNSIAATCMHTYIMSCPRKVCYGKLFLATDNQIAKKREGRPKVESWGAPRIERCISTERKNHYLNSGHPKILGTNSLHTYLSRNVLDINCLPTYLSRNVFNINRFPTYLSRNVLDIKMKVLSSSFIEMNHF